MQQRELRSVKPGRSTRAGQTFLCYFVSSIAARYPAITAINQDPNKQLSAAAPACPFLDHRTKLYWACTVHVSAALGAGTAPAAPRDCAAACSGPALEPAALWATTGRSWSVHSAWSGRRSACLGHPACRRRSCSRRQQRAGRADCSADRGLPAVLSAAGSSSRGPSGSGHAARCSSVLWRRRTGGGRRTARRAHVVGHRHTDHPSKLWSDRWRCLLHQRRGGGRHSKGAGAARLRLGAGLGVGAGGALGRSTLHAA